MSGVRSADRRGRPRLGFLVPRWSPSRGRTFLSAAPPDSRHVECWSATTLLVYDEHHPLRDAL